MTDPRRAWCGPWGALQPKKTPNLCPGPDRKIHKTFLGAPAQTDSTAHATNPPGHLWRNKWTILSGPQTQPRWGRTHCKGRLFCHKDLPPSRPLTFFLLFLFVQYMPLTAPSPPHRSRANMAHTRQSRPDYGLYFQVRKPSQVVSSLLGSGPTSTPTVWPLYTTISGARLCWELEDPKGPRKRRFACNQDMHPPPSHAVREPGSAFLVRVVRRPLRFWVP